MQHEAEEQQLKLAEQEAQVSVRNTLERSKLCTILQADYNRERVLLRRQQENEKVLRRAHQQLEAQRAQEQREARLEALRQLVSQKG